MVKKLALLHLHLHLGRRILVVTSLPWLPPVGTGLWLSTASSDPSFEKFVRSRFNVSSADDITKIFRMAPRLERLQSIRNVEDFVEFFTRLGCKEDEIAKIMVRHPVLLTAKASKLLEPKVQLLRNFGVVGKNLVKILTQTPRVLSTSLERGLHPTITFLENVFRSKHLLVKALVRNPSLLTCDLDRKLKPSQSPKLKSFASALRMQDEKFVEKFVNRHPESALLSEIYCTAIADVSSFRKISAKAFAF